MTSKNLKLAALFASAALAVWAVAALEDVLLPVVLAILLAYLLDPFVEWLTRRGLTRPRAIAAIYLAGIALAVAALLFGLPWMAGQAARLARHVTELPELGVRALAWIEDRLGLQLGLEHEARDLSEQAKAWLLAHRDQLPRVLGSTWTGLKGVGQVLLTAVLVPVYGYFFLLGLHRLPALVRDLLPAAYREKGMSFLTQVHQTMGAFFRGRLLICAGKGVVAATGMALGGVPLGICVGLASGVLSLVPFLSFPAAGAVGCAFALLEGQGLSGVLWVLGALAAAELFESAASPFILGREMALHPAVVLFSLFVGGKCMGFLGLLLAVPLAAVVKIVWREFLFPWWREAAERGGTADQGGAAA